MTAMDSATNNAKEMIAQPHAAVQPRPPGRHHQGADGDRQRRRGPQRLSRRTRTRNSHEHRHRQPARQGKVVQVIGPVVDVEFAGGDLPEINTALRISQPVDQRQGRATWWSRWRSTSASTTSAASPWTPPTAWCAACRSRTPARRSRCRSAARCSGRILNVVGEPVDERGPVTAEQEAPDPPRGAQVRRPVGARSRCSRPASRSSTCWRPTAAAARSACSAAPASARPSRCSSSSTTSPRSTAASRCSPASASAPARGATSTTRCRSRSSPTAASVLSKTALVYGQMNEPPGARARVALSALTVAEYFRDEEGQDVLLFIDNIFRFTQAGSEVSALLGRIPRAVGYQPTLATEMGELQERITSTNKGSITSVQAIYVPADDLTDPAPATAFAHLDATTVLSRAHLRAGHLPGGRSARLDVDHALAPRSSAPSTTAVARARCRRSCRSTRSWSTSSPSSAWTSCPRTTS